MRVERATGTWWLRWIAPADTRCLPASVHGTADTPDVGGRKWIYIREGLSEIETLRVLLHELRHTADPRASEEAIEAETDEDARILYALGYRRVADPVLKEEIPDWGDA